MRYRLRCLTPVLVGDGRSLAPIDYMIWKDHVNVLDQRRIFRLLARGPRLENYLAQLKRAEKLDFASWGGFAQNFADRRIRLEDPSSAAHWEKASSETLHIPTFASGPQGAYVPGSALKGALRTAVLFTCIKDGSLERVAEQLKGERPLRRPAEELEESALGEGGASRMRFVQIGDSGPAPQAAFRVYLLRVASLGVKGRGGKPLGWKQSPRGTADGDKPEQGTAIFAEMAAPGTVFEGVWREVEHLKSPAAARALRWSEPLSRQKVLEAANQYAGSLLAGHQRYCQTAGLAEVEQDVARLQGLLAEASRNADACLVCVGWGGGLLPHVAWLKTDDPLYRDIISRTGAYAKGVYAGLPFPKTRRIVFLKDRPAMLPGWALLQFQD